MHVLFFIGIISLFSLCCTSLVHEVALLLLVFILSSPNLHCQYLCLNVSKLCPVQSWFLKLVQINSLSKLSGLHRILAVGSVNDEMVLSAVEA